VAIIGLLVGVALPTYRNAQTKAKEAVLSRTCSSCARRSISTSPTRATTASVSALVDEGYLRKMPVDP